MQALAEIAKKMVSTLDFERVLDFIAAKVLELLKADAVMLFLSEQNSDLTLRTALGDADLERAGRSPNCPWAGHCGHCGAGWTAYHNH